jgi:hypothetical protein
MKERPGVGYFSQANAYSGNPGLVCDSEGKLYLNPDQVLTPSRDAHPHWTIQVSACKDGIAIHVPAPVMNNIRASGVAAAYLPVAKVLAEPVATVSYGHGDTIYI